MKKWRWHYLISILMIPVLLLACVRIYITPHVEEIEQLFLEHREEFDQLASALLKIADRNDPESWTGIIPEKYESTTYIYGGSGSVNFVDQIGSLNFYGYGPLYSQEEYENIHSAVAELCASLDLRGILFHQWRIDIAISFSPYGDCHLIYLPYHSSDAIQYEIKEKSIPSLGWYAVVTDGSRLLLS